MDIERVKFFMQYYFVILQSGQFNIGHASRPEFQSMLYISPMRHLTVPRERSRCLWPETSVGNCICI